MSKDFAKQFDVHTAPLQIESHIYYLSRATENYEPGWYFEDETNQFNNEQPFATCSEAQEALEQYEHDLQREPLAVEPI